MITTAAHHNQVNGQITMTIRRARAITDSTLTNSEPVLREIAFGEILAANRHLLAFEPAPGLLKRILRRTGRRS